MPLGPYDSCRLIASNLYSTVRDPFTENARIDHDKAYSIFYETQVLADIFIDLELEAVDRILTKIQPEYLKISERIHTDDPELSHDWLNQQSDEFKLWWKVREIGSKGRRTGTGITGYADMLAALGKNYGDSEVTDEIFKLKLKAELDASTDLAILHGAFPIWDRDKEMSLMSEGEGGLPVKDGETYMLSGTNKWYNFLLKTYPEQAIKMYNYGRRNSGLSLAALNSNI